MSMMTSVFLLLPVFLLGDCHENYQYEFRIVNDSDRAIFVNIQKLGLEQIDVNLLQSGQEIIVGVEAIEARNGNKASDELIVPFSSIELADLDGNIPEIGCDEGLLVPRCWSGFNPDRGDKFYWLNHRVDKFDFD